MGSTTANNSGDPEFPSGNDFSNESNPVAYSAESADNNILTIRMTGLYPFAGCKLRIDLTNSGTVPAHFTLESHSSTNTSGLSYTASVSSKSTNVPQGQAETVCKLLGLATSGKLNNSVSGVPGATVPQNNIGGNGGSNYGTTPVDQLDLGVGATDGAVQLHAGETVVCDIVVYANETAHENQLNISMSMELIGHQWNEGVTLGKTYNKH